MALSLAQITLYSKNSQGLATFLSEILDTEMRPCSEGIRVDYSSFGFLIIDHGEKSLPRGNMLINFSAESENELSELLQKIEFYRYRHAPGQQVPQIEKSERSMWFTLNDTDGRKWNFSFSW